MAVSRPGDRRLCAGAGLDTYLEACANNGQCLHNKASTTLTKEKFEEMHREAAENDPLERLELLFRQMEKSDLGLSRLQV